MGSRDMTQTPFTELIHIGDHQRFLDYMKKIEDNIEKDEPILPLSLRLQDSYCNTVRVRIYCSSVPVSEAKECSYLVGVAADEEMAIPSVDCSVQEEDMTSKRVDTQLVAGGESHSDDAMAPTSDSDSASDLSSTMSVALHNVSMDFFFQSGNVHSVSEAFFLFTGIKAGMNIVQIFSVQDMMNF